MALRLVCPFSPESMFSLIPSGETVSPSIMMDRSPSIDSGIEAINNVINPLISRSFTPSPVQSANPLQVLLPVLSVVWLTGMAILIIHAALSCLRLYRRLGTAVLLSENIYQGEFIDAPFVFGILHPKIYLPVGLEERDVGYVVAHEQAHIRRFDHWWKPLGYLLLAVHWFNPLVWVAYVLLCSDIEFACDEKVVSGLDAQQRACDADGICEGPVRAHVAVQ